MHKAGWILIFSLMINSAAASHIKCYSEGKKVYEGEPKVLLSDGKSFLAVYKDYDDVIFSKSCIITEKRHATRQRKGRQIKEGFFGEKQ